MKPIARILVAVLFFSASVNAQEVQWYTDMQEATAASIKHNKPMLLFFTGSDWCGWCIRLQKEVFLTSDFKKWAAKEVVLVELDFPRRKELPNAIRSQNNELQRLFGVRGYPTVWFVMPESNNNSALNRLGSTGYVAGGPSVWIDGAKQILANKK